MKELSFGEIKSESNPYPATHSGYGSISSGVLISAYQESTDLWAFHHSAHSYFKNLVLSPHFACVGAQSSVKGENYAFCAYPNMTTVSTAEGLCHDLIAFKQQFNLPGINKVKGAPFLTFVAAFSGPNIADQIDGIKHFYTLLKQLHEQDKKYFKWGGVDHAQYVSNDVNSPDFGFSLSGDAFFMPFLYSYSGSPARISSIPMVVFNAHVIFAKLRQINAFERLKTLIRSRQTWVHPALGDHGDVKEFDQYALVDPDGEVMQKEQEIRKRVLGEKPFQDTDA